MATRAQKENELLTPANLERVIALLEPLEGKPASKKNCCAMLMLHCNHMSVARVFF